MVALSGAAAAFPRRVFASTVPLPQTPAAPTEAFWRDVRARFLLPADVTFLNAANMCPASLPAIEAVERNTRRYEANPSPAVRSELMKEREAARALLAEAMRVTPAEIVITRNTSEGNNMVSSGVVLAPGDEVVLWADNHPSNLNAWRQRATRFGFTVITVPVPPSHPGVDGYVELFTKAFTPRTKVVAFSHVSSNSGDLLPAAEICAAARARGVLSLVDGAQTFGLLDINLAAMKPDFYTGSMHKWPCGPKETGMLYVNQAAQDRIHPSVVSLYGGQTGISRTHEAHGQRDDARIAAVADALKFQGSIGRATIERRSRDLAQALMAGLKALPGVKMWTSLDPSRSAGIVIFQPGTLDVQKLGAALADKDRIVCTTRAGAQNPGLRFAAHFYNTMEEMDRTVGAIKRYLSTGV